uniref:Pheromone biosynthesis-activating neuropeptide n=1 Tax=Ascotis selenaria cretacea TaxID=414917 RepID=A6BMD6_9NEOP|nr:pheromone biosynthesis-activating neuropeptide precursor [Ascotis selenaria cretacea]
MIFSLEKSVFVIISVSFVLTAGNDLKEDGEREANSDRQGLWFGPRLGKRSLHLSEEDNRDLYLRMMEAADAMSYYYNQLPLSMTERSDPDARVTKKVIFTPKLGRSVDFTPRLGRQLVDDVPQRQQIEEDRLGSRTRFFSPRLGRTTMNFSPRLGRELAYENYPSSVRVARSVNNTKNNKH